mgnify:FL=1
MKKIGISGGTFNPIHLGHLIIAELFAGEMKLDKCFFVPAWLSPYKTENNEAQNIAPDHRAKMVKLAIEDNERFDIDLFEIKKKGVSYTYDTILHFEKKYPDAEIFLLIGTDQAKDFQGWSNWEKIISKVRLSIACRPNIISDNEKNKINESLSLDDRSPIWLQTPLLEISSTNIRQRAKRGESIKYLVPFSVENYILKNRLYS